MKVRHMPHVTVEQVLRLRDHAIELERQLDELVDASQYLSRTCSDEHWEHFHRILDEAKK